MRYPCWLAESHILTGWPSMNMPQPYKARSFDLSNLKGISDQTLNMHFKLYEGYVNASNQLTRQIGDILKMAGVSGSLSWQAGLLMRNPSMSRM